MDTFKNSNILRINSDPNRSTKFNKHTQPGSTATKGESRPVSPLEKFKSTLGIYYFLFALMESSGCRFSEIRSISYLSISSYGSVLVKGKKGSHDRFLQDQRSTNYLLKSKSIERDPFHGCHIDTANRHLKRIGLITQKKGRKNLTLSGIFRESYAKQIREVSPDDSTVSKFIGHKSATNGSFYGKG